MASVIVLVRLGSAWLAISRVGGFLRVRLVRRG